MRYFNTIPSSRKRKIISILIAVFLLASYSLVVFAVAPSGGYQPGDTLDPDCAPNDTDCLVTVGGYTFDTPLVNTAGVVSIPAASGSIDGYLSASDWSAFNAKENGLGTGTSAQYLRGDKTFATLNTTVVPEGTNLYWTNNRFDTRIASVTSIPNLQTIGTITSGVWHGAQITDAYISDSITASNYIPLSQKGAPNGVATLDSGGKITPSQLSSFSLSDTFVVNSEAEMLNLTTAELGDVAIRLDVNKSYILTTNDPADVNNWQEIITPLNHVIAVNGQTGAVNLTTTDINEGLNLYYTDSRVDDYLNTQKGIANGIASLDANGHIPTSQIGSIVLNETFVVPNQAAMLAIVGAHNGDLAVITGTNETYVLADENNPTNISSWVQIVNGVPVTSVNGQTGVVNLTTTNISEGSNQYFTNTRARNAVTATGPLTYNAMTGVFGISASSASTNGYLSAVDWSTFNNKQNALTFGNVTSSNPEIVITGGTGAVIGGGLDISVPDASDTVRGLVTTGAQNFAGVKTFTNNVGIGDTTPSTLFSVGSGGLFQVDLNGNLVKINNVSYNWPSAPGGVDTVLVNDGSGGLSWSSNGLISLNGLPDATQTFATSMSGSDFSITSSAGVHTFNFPTASPSARGLLSSAVYTEFNNKPFVDTSLNNVTTLALSSGTQLATGGGINNIVFGYQAGDAMTTGNNNTLLGYQAGKNITTGVTHSFFAGSQAGLSATSATNSNFIGQQAGQNASGASYANFFGRLAGQNATSAQYGVFIGDSAGSGASGASNATFIGQSSGLSATGATYSNFIGTSAGYQASGATTANFIGYGAGYIAINAQFSNFIGRLAGNAASSAAYSNFIGFQAGNNAVNATNSIFIGKNAGNGDLVNNVASGSSIAIGDGAGTGGNSNSIALGASAVNTLANQFLIGSSYTNFNVRGINYIWPAAQAGGAGQALVNNGSGTLSWASVAAVGGTSGQLQYNNAGALAGAMGVTYDGTNFDANDNVFRMVDNADMTKRAMFEVSGIDAGTTRTYTFPNAAGTLALANIGTSGTDINYSNGTLNVPTASASNRGLLSAADWTLFNDKLGSLSFGVIGSSSNANGLTFSGSTLNLEPASGSFGGVVSTGAQTFAGNKTLTGSLTLAAGTSTLSSLIMQSGTNLTTAVAGRWEYNGTELFFTPTGTLRSTIVMTGLTGYNTYSKVSKGATSFTSGTNNFLVGNLAGSGLTYGSDNNFLGYQAGDSGEVSGSNFFGYFAGSGASSATGSNFFGQQSGQGATNAIYSNFFSQYSGNSATSASYSNFFGYAAGYTASNASNSNFFGQNAGNGASGASDTIAIGQNAGRNATGATESIFMGKNAGYNATSTGITGDWNIALGSSAGNALTTGSYNVLLGYQTSDALTTGSKNIAIGYNIDLPSNTADGQLTIGNLIFGTGIDGAGTTLSTGKVGIGVAVPGEKLDVAGSVRSAAGGFVTKMFPDSTGSRIQFGLTATADNSMMEIGGYNAKNNIDTKGRDLQIFSTIATTGLTFKQATGNFGVGTIAPAQRLDVVGAAADTTVMRIATTSGNACTFSTTTGVFSCASDSRLKHDISSIDSADALTKLGQLNPVMYRYNWQNQNEPLIAGFVAQEFETVFPDLVTTDSITGYKSLSYAPLMPYTIKAIQEMNLKITEIGIMEKQNSWRDALVAWFANTANGITEFFSKKVSTEELCVKDAQGQTCITRSQLDALLSGQSIQAPPPQNPTPPDPVTCTAPEVLNADGTACETPSTPTVTCNAPEVLNSDGTACETPSSEGQEPETGGDSGQ